MCPCKRGYRKHRCGIQSTGMADEKHKNLQPSAPHINTAVTICYMHQPMSHILKHIRKTGPCLLVLLLPLRLPSSQPCSHMFMIQLLTPVKVP